MIPPGKNVDIILHTVGGSSINAKLLIDALMNHNGRRRIFIPYKAYSAGTLISLTGHCIYMNKNAHLTPFDTQITINNSDLFNTSIPVGILSKLSNISKDDHNNLLMIHTKMAKREYYADLKMLDVIFNKLYKHKPVQKMKIIENFLRTKLPHEYPISVTEARDFGLNISSHMPKLMEKIEFFLH
jgi:hypothetical protein